MIHKKTNFINIDIDKESPGEYNLLCINLQRGMIALWDLRSHKKSLKRTCAKAI